MKKIISLSIIFCLSFLLAVAPKVSADTYGTYGGGSTPNNLVINKEVKNPISNIYVENLGSMDPTFSPGTQVSFRLVVTNGSGETMHPVTVVDQLPSYLTFVSSSVTNTYDKGLNKVTFILENMIAGQTRTIDLLVSVAPRSAFPADRSLFCVTNFSKVTSPARPNGDEDTSEICLTTGQGNLPVAGVNDLFALIPFITLGGIGTVLLKKK